MASFNALFTNINTPVSRDYENIIERDYNSALIPVDFDDVNNTFTKINSDIREATRGLIQYTVTPQDFQDANVLMISSLYFKGKWKVSNLNILLRIFCHTVIQLKIAFSFHSMPLKLYLYPSMMKMAKC